VQFNSIEFPIFVLLVFALYWAIPSQKPRNQNLLILAASYLFYGWWDWRFLSLLAFNSLFNFQIGTALGRTTSPSHRKALLIASLTCNLGILGFFKYFNFFIESLWSTWTLFGKPVGEGPHFEIILPLGISFYTFQVLSYTIDVYQGRIKPTQKASVFFAYLSFFPQLVAGPIERGKNLLPQFQNQRKFDYDQATDGLRQILWGLVKKLLIADACAPYVQTIFSNPSDYSGSTLLLGAILFSFQIYGDFSGYTDMAIGTARLLGFNLSRNFNYPYFSRDIAEFWRRWHISLTSWFKEYLYIPLGGSRQNHIISIRNTFIVFLVSGFWHGANWTFIVWGAYNAIFFLPLLLANTNRKHLDGVESNAQIPRIKVLIQMGATFLLVCIGWVLFRSENLTNAFVHLRGILSLSLFTLPQIRPTNLLLMLFFFTLAEWTQRAYPHAMHNIHVILPTRLLRYSLYTAIIAKVTLDPAGTSSFIYFQF